MLVASLMWVGRLTVILQSFHVLYSWLSSTKTGGHRGSAHIPSHNADGIPICPKVVRIRITDEIEDLINGYAATHGAVIHHLHVWQFDPERVQTTISSSQQEPQSTEPLWRTSMRAGKGNLFRSILELVQDGICSPLQRQIKHAEILLAKTRPETTGYFEFARHWIDKSCDAIEGSAADEDAHDSWSDLGNGPLNKILRHLETSRTSVNRRQIIGIFGTDGDDGALINILLKTLFERPWPVSHEELLDHGYQEEGRDRYEAFKLLLRNGRKDIEPELRNDLDPTYRHLLRRTIRVWEGNIHILRTQLLPAVSLYLADEVQKKEDLAEQESRLRASLPWWGRPFSLLATPSRAKKHVNDMVDIVGSARRQIDYLQLIISSMKSWEARVAALEARRAAISAQLEMSRDGHLWPLTSPTSSSGECQTLATYTFPDPRDLWDFLGSAIKELEKYKKDVLYAWTRGFKRGKLRREDQKNRR